LQHHTRDQSYTRRPSLEQRCSLDGSPPGFASDILSRDTLPLGDLLLWRHGFYASSSGMSGIPGIASLGSPIVASASSPESLLPGLDEAGALQHSSLVLASCEASSHTA